MISSITSESRRALLSGAMPASASDSSAWNDRERSPVFGLPYRELFLEPWCDCGLLFSLLISWPLEELLARCGLRKAFEGTWVTSARCWSFSVDVGR